MTTTTSFGRLGRWLVPAVGLAAALAVPARAQKVQDERLWTTFHKSPILALKPQYATYSLDYDLGSVVMTVDNRPALQGLTYQKADGDLLLRITVKNFYETGRRLVENNSGAYSAYYAVDYKADYGYELRDSKTDQVLASYRNTSGTTTSRAFQAPGALRAYMANNFMGETIRELLAAVSQRADFVLNPHDYKAGLTLNLVDGPAPAYADINKATTDLKALLSSSAPIDRAQVQALAAAWQQQLGRVNWEDKKSEINKKVAAALLENLCSAALLTEDYPKLGQYAAEYQKHDTSLLRRPLFFQADMTYGGTSPAPPPTVVLGRDRNTHRNVYYHDLAADLALPK